MVVYVYNVVEGKVSVGFAKCLQVELGAYILVKIKKSNSKIEGLTYFSCYLLWLLYKIHLIRCHPDLVATKLG